jgi:hypothetical protein
MPAISENELRKANADVANLKSTLSRLLHPTGYTVGAMRTALSDQAISTPTDLKDVAYRRLVDLAAVFGVTP